MTQYPSDENENENEPLDARLFTIREAAALLWPGLPMRNHNRGVRRLSKLVQENRVRTVQYGFGCKHYIHVDEIRRLANTGRAAGQSRQS